MPKPYVFPDPDDRSKNSPYADVPSARVINLYNQSTDSDARRLTEKIRTWFKQEALDLGWDDAEFSDTGCRLTNTRVKNL